MRKFERHRGIAVPLLRSNVDTDAIIPSCELTRVSKTGLGDGLFAGWRYERAGDGRDALKPDFVLNRPEYAGASILLTGPNFGCGSSREHAVWALADFGFMAVIAPSFGSIFRRNCYRNGLLPVALPIETVQSIAESCAEDPPRRRVTVDLRIRQVEDPGGASYAFDIPDAVRERLLLGMDEIDLTLRHAGEIENYRHRKVAERPWATAPVKPPPEND